MKIYITNYIEGDGCTYQAEHITGVWSDKDKAEDWIIANLDKPEYRGENRELRIDEYEIDKEVE